MVAVTINGVMLPADRAGHPGSKQTPVQQVALFCPDG